MDCELVPLGNVVIEVRPGFASKFDLDDGVFQFRMNNLTREGRLDLTKRRRIPADTKRMEPYYLKPGDVLFNATNSPELVGKSAYIRELDEPAVFSNHFFRVRVDHRLMEPRFLWRWLQLQWQRGTFRSRAHQWVNQATFGRDSLMELPVPVPPIVEQEHIAGRLDKVDDLRIKRRRCLSLVDALYESLFLDMFGDPVRNIAGYPMTSLGSLGKVMTGNTPPRSNANNFGDHIEWIKSDNIRPPLPWLTSAAESLSEAGERAGRVVPAGALLVTCIAGSPASIGNVALADRPVAFNQQINALIPSEAEPRYLHMLLTVGKALVQRASTASMKGLISKSRFEAIELPVAPLHRQREYVQRAERLDRVREKMALSEHHCDELMAALQDRAFRAHL